MFVLCLLLQKHLSFSEEDSLFEEEEDHVKAVLLKVCFIAILRTQSMHKHKILFTNLHKA